MVFFEGGGACWDAVTCSLPRLPGVPPQLAGVYKQEIPASDDPTVLDGLFNLSNPANPVKDWTFVYIPYCTGDVHLGSKDVTYQNVIGNPFVPASYTIHHRGFDNFMVVLEWMKAHVGQPRRLLVTGSSAGAYGAMGNFPWLAETFRHARAAVLGDAGQGVTTATWDAAARQGNWNFQLAPWVFGTDAGAVRSDQVAKGVAQHYRRARFAQFTTHLDTTQVNFYATMKRFYPPGGLCPNVAVDWNNLMLPALGDTATLPNFRFFVADGTYHTILRYPHFYTDVSAGQPFSQWLHTMLTGDLERDDERCGHDDEPVWTSAACPTCLTPLPCQ
ncbi:MAG: pectin acetylesterase-family hydrolase [Myxococcota bacterium]